MLREVNAESHSSSELLCGLLYGAARKGTVLSRHNLLFGDYVVTLSPLRAAKLPNGVECRVTASSRTPVSIGRGRLLVGKVEIRPGPAWSPVPVFEPLVSLPAGPEPASSGIATWMAATHTTGDALLAGYVAGLVLLHGQHKRAERIASRAAQRSTPVDATVLRHAARGEVPEPVHYLLAQRDPARLLAFTPAGILWLRGLISAGYPLETATVLAAPGLRKPALSPRSALPA